MEMAEAELVASVNVDPDGGVIRFVVELVSCAPLSQVVLGSQSLSSDVAKDMPCGIIPTSTPFL